MTNNDDPAAGFASAQAMVGDHNGLINANAMVSQAGLRLAKVAGFIAQVVEIDRKRPGHLSSVECV